jgi:predicted RNA methylase
VRIANDVLAVLDRCEIDGRALTLPGQLERRDYLAVNKVIEAAGGKWNRRERAHLFADPAEPIIDTILLTGEVVSRRQELQFFETPAEIVGRMLDMAEVCRDDLALEPSAGRGAIASALAGCALAVDCVEIDERNAEAIRTAGYARGLWLTDFLTLDPDPAYDVIVMNPPFARQQDIAHVLHALKFLRPGLGVLVSVMSLGVTFRENRAARDFRVLVTERGGEFVPLPDDAFKESGTGVKTVIVTIPAVTP